MKPVQVKWVDSMTLNYGDWDDREPLEEAMQPQNMEHESVGYLFSENEHAILLAGSYYKQDEGLPDRAGQVLLIPRAAILSILEMRPVAKYRKREACE